MTLIIHPTPGSPMLMGIVNVTPDSFSDGGRFLEPEAAVERALRLQEEGADLLDFGAESTRPGAAAVPASRQFERLVPVLKAFRRQSQLPVSIDTRSADVARACLDLGADIVNDVSAMRHDDGMTPLVSRRNCPVILMHMLGTPRTMQDDPRYGDVVRDVVAFFEERLAACEQAGIQRSRVWIDPGIGFGKTVLHNLELLRRLGEFVALGVPVLVGHSRKSFLGTISGELVPERRVSGSVAAGILAARNGASVLRVHDVAEHRQALAVWGALDRKQE
jgi:dihydropteroate synthase